MLIIFQIYDLSKQYRFVIRWSVYFVDRMFYYRMEKYAGIEEKII